MAVRMPHMKEFLFGYSIRTGSIVIGTVSLVSAVILILPALMYGFGAIKEVEMRTQPLIIATSDQVAPNNNDKEMIKAYVGVTIFACILQAIVGGLLLIGSIKKIRWLLIPWLIISVITFILLIIGFLYFAIATLAVGPALTMDIQRLSVAHSYISGIIKLLFSLVICAYTTCVVFAYATELREYHAVSKRQAPA